MDKDLFEYSDYRKYLADKLLEFPNKGRGMKSQLANFIGCQSSFLSHVLSGKCDFSLEQLEKISRFLGHTNMESRYFMVLLLHNRAGTHELQLHFQMELEEIQQKRNQLKNRRKGTKKISNDAREKYYSSWLYQAIRIILDLPSCDSLEGICKELNISRSRALQILNFLIENDLVEQKKNRYNRTSHNIFLAKDSSVLQKYHYNWRVKAMNSIDDHLSNNLHYSACFTIGKEDALFVRKMILNFIEKLGKKVNQSEAEELQGLCIDLFKV